MDAQTEIRRDQKATELATFMLEQSDTMREIVEETLTSAKSGDIKEAGRTLCPSNTEIRGPLNRFPRAIDLAACPVGRGGTWHTHVTPREIRGPVNSLPDMANVVYGLTNVSIVVGTETADVIVAPDNPDAAREVFRNAIGSDVDGPRELSDAIRSGRIPPTKSRQRARNRLSPLVYQVGTGFKDLERDVSSIPPDNWAASYGSGRDESFSGNRAGMTAFTPESFQTAAQAGEDIAVSADIRDEIISTAIGTVVGGIIARAVFGE